jgi:signal transduction histidine kinase
MGRAGLFLVIYILLLKILLISKDYVRNITHVMLWGGLIIIWSNVFMAAHAVNIITLQFVFMAMVSSFYLLGRRPGIIYSVLSTIPILLYLILYSDGNAHVGAQSHEIAPPGGLVLTALNFVTLILSHYLYHQALSRNVEEKEEINRQLQQSVAEAKRLAQSKSDFLSTMSHELRTPLISVIGISELLIENPHNERQKEDLRILRFSASGLHTLINNILDFNKLETDKFYLEKLNVNLGDLLNNVCMGLSLQARDKGIVLKCEADERVKKQIVVTDPTRLTQIIYNLTGNGIKFTKKGEVSVNLSAMSESENKITVRFSISDTGIGIHPDQHQAIFDPFVQASSNTTRQYGGTGLGLPIVKRLLEMFRSKIHMESIPGVGSTFSFEITFDKGEVDPLVIDLDSDGRNLEGLRVLLAEDNSMNVYLLEKLFHKWGVDYEIASNGDEALEKVATQTYDLVLMDIHMPFRDGYQTAKEIRMLPDPVRSSIPIIALTASVSDDLKHKIEEAGMNDYLHKPFNASELFQRMKHYYPAR